jgi:hypothetical protein
MATLPTTITAQNGAQLKQTTRVAVTGCPRTHGAKKARRAKHARKAKRAGHRATFRHQPGR